MELKGSAGRDREEEDKRWREAEKPEKSFNPPLGSSKDGTPARLPLTGGFRAHPEAQQGFTMAEHPNALYLGGALHPCSFTILFLSPRRRNKPS